jgi:hypothetical protein
MTPQQFRDAIAKSASPKERAELWPRHREQKISAPVAKLLRLVVSLELARWAADAAVNEARTPAGRSGRYRQRTTDRRARAPCGFARAGVGNADRRGRVPACARTI